MTEWCLSVGSGDIAHETCLPPHAFFIAIAAECFFYILCGMGLWKAFKLRQRKKLEMVMSKK